jgi:hypothetical protein
MAQHWTAKAPSDVVERTWTPKEGEGVSSRTLTVSTGTATLSSEIQGEDILVTVTGGASDVTQIIAASAVLGNGETITETIYIPVIATANDFAYTGQDICDFALRKITGNGVTADASELDDALERLSDMLAAWKGQGADLGVVLPVVNATVFYISDEFASAIKHNLILELADLYEYAPSARVIDNARRGLQQVKTAKLSKEREGASYY